MAGGSFPRGTREWPRARAFASDGCAPRRRRRRRRRRQVCRCRPRRVRAAACRCAYVSRTSVCTSGVSRSTWVVRRRRDRTQRPSPTRKTTPLPPHPATLKRGPHTPRARLVRTQAGRRLCVRVSSLARARADGWNISQSSGLNSGRYSPARKD
jgi:hypothetical protein